MVNEGEAGQLLGKAWHEEPNLATALGVDAVVMTRGSHGAILDTAEGERVTCAAPSVSARDTTGCGDAFSGVLLTGLCAGTENLAASLRKATHWAAYVAEFDGAAASYQAAFDRARKEQLPGIQTKELERVHNATR